MGSSCEVLVDVVVVSVVMDVCGVGQNSFAFEEAEISSWGFLLTSRAIFRPIASDSSNYAFFFCLAHYSL